nr:MAG TPA: hypothetical protein [Bacteriophage sp.]
MIYKILRSEDLQWTGRESQIKYLRGISSADWIR